MGWFSRKKAPPQSVEEQAMQSAMQGRFNTNWRITYERKRLPGPGTNNYALETLGLVEFSPIGPAESNRLHFRPMQPQQLYVGFSTYLTGLGGLAQGTFYGQPLIGPQIDVDGQING